MPTNDLDVAVLRRDVDQLQDAISRLQVLVENQGKEFISIDKAFAVMSSSIEYIKQGQDKLNNNVSKLFWAFALAFVAAGANWILKGGLTQ